MKRLALALALALIAAPAAAEDRMTLLLEWFVNPDHGPIILAEELGYFADEGLEVEIVAPSNPADPPKMVAAGQAEIAVSYQPELHLQVDQGLPLIRVGTLVATPLNCLLVRADGPVATIADLKGRKVGYSVGGVEEVVLDVVLGQHGLSADDVEMVNVNFALSPALMSGQVDAVIGAYRNFELNQMEIEGVEGRCFPIEAEGVPPYDELIYIANPARMDRDMVNRFLAATERAVQYIVNNPEASWDVFKGYQAELDDRLNRMAWVDTIPRFALRPAALDAGRYVRFERFLAEAGLVEGIAPVSDLAIDPGAQ